MLVIGDADAVIALYGKTDGNHSEAKRVVSLLISKNTEIYFPVTAVSEAITSAKRRLTDPLLAKVIIAKVLSGELSLFSIEEEHVLLAASFFDADDSKQNTYFDAVVAAAASKSNATAIFSFDAWYEKKGFVLASDLS